MLKLQKAETNNMEECGVAQANKIYVNEYEVNFFQLHMIMNTDTAIHTCNA